MFDIDDGSTTIENIPEGCCKRKYVPKITGYRRGLHSDLPALEQLISVKTYDIFGDIDIGQV